MSEYNVEKTQGEVAETGQETKVYKQNNNESEMKCKGFMTLGILDSVSEHYFSEKIKIHVL